MEEKTVTQGEWRVHGDTLALVCCGVWFASASPLAAAGTLMMAYYCLMQLLKGLMQIAPTHIAKSGNEWTKPMPKMILISVLVLVLMGLGMHLMLMMMGPLLTSVLLSTDTSWLQSALIQALCGAANGPLVAATMLPLLGGALLHAARDYAEAQAKAQQTPGDAGPAA